jgi:hypothetical protein
LLGGEIRQALVKWQEQFQEIKKITDLLKKVLE